MHNQRLETGHVTYWSGIRTSTLRAYLDQLVDNLDDSSLRATLKLMICEARSAIHERRRLTSLEARDGRESSAQTDELRELETMHDQLVALYRRYTDGEDDLMLAHEPVRRLSVVLAT